MASYRGHLAAVKAAATGAVLAAGGALSVAVLVESSSGRAPGASAALLSRRCGGVGRREGAERAWWGRQGWPKFRPPTARCARSGEPRRRDGDASRRKRRDRRRSRTSSVCLRSNRGGGGRGRRGSKANAGEFGRPSTRRRRRESNRPCRVRGRRSARLGGGWLEWLVQRLPRGAGRCVLGGRCREQSRDA